VRTLANGRVAVESTSDVQRQLADNLKAMIELWRARPEHQVLDVLEQSRSAARDAAQQLDRSLAAAGTRMLEAVERLDEATVTATQSMTRAASGMSSTMSEMSQRLEVEVQHVLDAVQKAATQHEQQLELWRTSLEHARTSLDHAHTGLDEQYRRSMGGFAASSEAFTELAERTADQVRSLPDPAERLAGLWDGVRQLETDLIEAIGGSVMELGALRERVEQLSSSLEQLGSSSDRTAELIGSGGGKLAGSLQRELAQMNGIIEEYVALLENTPRTLKVRA
jgi:hypothetical protein